MKNIQWFPGHMTKAIRRLSDYNKVIDLVIELVDARAPVSSKVHEFQKIFNNKYRLLILNKSDLADLSKLNRFVKQFDNYDKVVYMNLTNNKDVKYERSIFFGFQVRF